MPLKSKRFDFENQKGEILSGKLELPEGDIKAVAVFAHCFTCSKNILAATRIPRSLAKHGIGTLRFDFTGLGNSEGDFANTNFSSNVEDLIAATTTLREKGYPVKMLIGHSLGGAAVLAALPQIDDINAIVTIGAPSDTKHVIHHFKSKLEDIEKNGEAVVDLSGRQFKIKKQFIDDLNEATILDGLSKCKAAFLTLHSPIDETVSIDHASKIFLAAKHPRSFISLDNANHLITNARDAEYVANVISAWVERYIH